MALRCYLRPVRGQLGEIGGIAKFGFSALYFGAGIGWIARVSIPCASLDSFNTRMQSLLVSRPSSDQPQAARFDVYVARGTVMSPESSEIHDSAQDSRRMDTQPSLKHHPLYARCMKRGPAECIRSFKQTRGIWSTFFCTCCPRLVFTSSFSSRRYVCHGCLNICNKLDAF